MRKRVNIFEQRVEEKQRNKEEEEARQRLYEKNRANIKERMRRLKKFIFERTGGKTNEQFFLENKDYFEQYNVKNFKELQRLIHNYDRENPDEFEKFENEKYKKYLKIDHIKGNDMSIMPEIRTFNISSITLNSGINNIFINAKKYFKKLQNCNTSQYTFIPNKIEYITNKIKSYIIKHLNNDFIKGIKKFKYNNKFELIESSNISNITLEKISNNKLCNVENYFENGIPVDELRNRKIKKMVNNLSEVNKKNYDKVKTIIGNLKNKDKHFSILNKKFCVDCNKYFKDENVGDHHDHCILQINNNLEIDNDLNYIDYNANLNKLYDHLKKDQNKILKNGNQNLIIYYGKLLYYLYEIIINNNSIEELNLSIININDDYIKEIESQTFNDYFKDYFLFFIQRISKLTYFKIKKIEKLLADLEEVNKNINLETDVIDDEEESNNNLEKIERMIRVLRNSNGNLDEILSPKQSGNLDSINFNFNKITEEEKKKYFLKVGLRIKFNYGKNEYITELYSKAKELNLQPFQYEDFLMKELNISKGHHGHHYKN